MYFHLSFISPRSSPISSLREQDFINYVSLRDYRNAIQLALAMEQPGRLYSLFSAIRSQRTSTPTSVTGNASVDQVIQTLGPLELARLLKFIRNWNANNKTGAVAQTVLHAVLKLRSAKDVLGAFEGANLLRGGKEGEEEEEEDETPMLSKEREMKALKELLDGLIPYTERHLTRMEKMVQDSYVVDYVLNEMDSGLITGGDAMLMEVG